MRAYLTAAVALRETILAAERAVEDAARRREQGQPPVDARLPDSARDWLVRIRLLEGVPFDYVVPDEELVPTESIRFFYVDRNWTDALVQGALAVSAITTRDRAQLVAAYDGLRDELDAAERQRRVRAIDPEGPVEAGPAEVATGFLLRSRAVSGWPGLHVNAFRGEEALRLLRLERLAPAVLLCLVDGVPDAVWIEEPRAGLQFGVKYGDPQLGQSDRERYVRLRRPSDGSDLPGPREVRVPFRPDAPGVIDMTTLRDRMLAEDGPANPLGTTLSSAEYALQMVQYPYRQVFGSTEAGPSETELGPVLATAIGPLRLAQWYGVVLPT